MNHCNHACGMCCVAYKCMYESRVKRFPVKNDNLWGYVWQISCSGTQLAEIKHWNIFELCIFLNCWRGARIVAISTTFSCPTGCTGHSADCWNLCRPVKCFELHNVSQKRSNICANAAHSLNKTLQLKATFTLRNKWKRSIQTVRE
jgi:hypothetical protein